MRQNLDYFARHTSVTTHPVGILWGALRSSNGNREECANEGGAVEDRLEAAHGEVYTCKPTRKHNGRVSITRIRKHAQKTVSLYDAMCICKQSRRHRESATNLEVFF